ncbi:hypothetical protein RFI_39673, partial [Reticulomyxa filosa]
SNQEKEKQTLLAIEKFTKYAEEQYIAYAQNHKKDVKYAGDKGRGLLNYLLRNYKYPTNMRTMSFGFENKDKPSNEEKKEKLMSPKNTTAKSIADAAQLTKNTGSTNNTNANANNNNNNNNNATTSTKTIKKTTNSTENFNSNDKKDSTSN